MKSNTKIGSRDIYYLLRTPYCFDTELFNVKLKTKRFYQFMSLFSIVPGSGMSCSQEKGHNRRNSLNIPHQSNSSNYL